MPADTPLPQTTISKAASLALGAAIGAALFGAAVLVHPLVVVLLVAFVGCPFVVVGVMEPHDG